MFEYCLLSIIWLLDDCDYVGFLEDDSEMTVRWPWDDSDKTGKCLRDYSEITFLPQGDQVV